MDDYISRENVIDFCEGVIKTHTDGSHRQRVARAFENAKAFFETIPAADVRPVVRGRWIFDRGDLATCSNCGSEILKRDVRNHKFCHYCGADMRKEDGTDV